MSNKKWVFEEILKNDSSFFNLNKEILDDYNIQTSKARLNFLNTSKIDTCVRPFIAESWKKCKKNNLDPYTGACGEIVDNALFATIEKTNSLLISSAVPVIDMIHDSFDNDFLYLVLTDTNGVILYTRLAMKDTMIDSLGKMMHYSIGSRWTEELIGTNAISLALQLNRPVATLFSEHFCDMHQNFACNSSVIYDNNGNQIGCFNITSHKQSYNPQFQAIVNAGALAIQRNINIQYAQNIIDHTFDSISEAILVVNSHLTIEKYNNHFLRLLNIKEAAVKSLDICSMFPEINFNHIFVNKEIIKITETKIHYKNQSLNIYIKISPMNVAGIIDCIVLVISKAKDIIQISNQVSGHKAAYSFSDILSKDPKMYELIEHGKVIASLNCSVLIEGESGTGKELFAHSIHNASYRRNSPFIAVNCAAIPHDLVESELFGYNKGAFTGALSKGNPGKFELADGGTIFLDEIGELPLQVQSKLLRVLDNSKISRIGSIEEMQLNVRVIAATNRNLYMEVKNKNFREDLYYRLNVMYLKIPPLRERIDDIDLLLDYFLAKLNSQSARFIQEVTDGFFHPIKNYRWNGNIRELQNVISRAYYLCKGNSLEKKDIPDYILFQEEESNTDSIIAPKSKSTFDVMSKDESEKELIIHAIKVCNGKITEAAKKIKMGKTTIYRKIKEYNIDLNNDIR